MLSFVNRIPTSRGFPPHDWQMEGVQMSDHIPDLTKMISDTPRTDAAYFKPGATMYDLAGEMKLVERELNAANDRIKRLEAAGDEAIYPFEYAARVRIWTEAKEAKP